MFTVVLVAILTLSDQALLIFLKYLLSLVP